MGPTDRCRDVLGCVDAKISKSAIVLLADVDDGVAELVPDMTTCKYEFARKRDYSHLNTSGPFAKDGVITLKKIEHSSAVCTPSDISH